MYLVTKAANSHALNYQVEPESVDDVADWNPPGEKQNLRTARIKRLYAHRFHGNVTNLYVSRLAPLWFETRSLFPRLDDIKRERRGRAERKLDRKERRRIKLGKT